MRAVISKCMQTFRCISPRSTHLPDRLELAICCGIQVRYPAYKTRPEIIMYVIDVIELSSECAGEPKIEELNEMKAYLGANGLKSCLCLVRAALRVVSC